MDTGVQRPVLAEPHSVAQLGQSDQHEAEQRGRVPLVVAQDMKVLEDLLVEEVGLVEEEDGVDALLAELTDVLVDRVEDRGRRGARAQAEREAELPVEVASPEGGVVAVGQAEAGLGQAMAERARRGHRSPPPTRASR